MLTSEEQDIVVSARKAVRGGYPADRLLAAQVSLSIAILERLDAIAESLSVGAYAGWIHDWVIACANDPALMKASIDVLHNAEHQLRGLVKEMQRPPESAN